MRLVSEDKADSWGVHQSGRMFVFGRGVRLPGKACVAALRVRFMTLSRANCAISAMGILFCSFSETCVGNVARTHGRRCFSIAFWYASLVFRSVSARVSNNRASSVSPFGIGMGGREWCGRRHFHVDDVVICVEFCVRAFEYVEGHDVTVVVCWDEYVVNGRRPELSLKGRS